MKILNENLRACGQKFLISHVSGKIFKYNLKTFAALR